MRWLLCLLAALPAVGRPVVYWYSAPVRAGQAVVALGGGWGDAPRVSVAPLPNDAIGAAPAWQAAEVLAASDAGVQFVLPAGEAVAFAARVEGAGGTSETVVINRPEPWWVQGDAGLSATPGGWLRVQGRCLAAGDRPVTAELQAAGQTRAVPVASATAYSLRLTVPPDVPAGPANLRLHTGIGGRLGWSDPLPVTIVAAEPWPDRIIDVKAAGAVGDGLRDDTAAVLAAIAKAGEAGGGVVSFPRGRYALSDTLTLPPRVTLRGEGQDRTALMWGDPPAPLPAQIRGTHHFRVEQLAIHCSDYQHVIAGATTAAEGWGHVRLDHVTVRANPYRGHLKPEDVDARFRASLKLSTGGGDTVRLGGPNLQITDCDLYGAGRSLFLSGPQGAVVARNRFVNGRWGWYCLSGSNGLILEDNEIRGGDLMSTGGGINCLYGYNASEHVYYARNRLADMHGWDREAMTSDAGGGAYHGLAASAEGATIKLAAPIDNPRKKDWAGAALFITNGPGRGQVRRVVAAADDTVTVDQPFDPAPGPESEVSLTMLQRRYLLLDNTFADAGIGIQFYGCAVEHVCDGNTVWRAGGFHAQARRYTTGVQPNLGIQFLRCRIAEGNSYRFGANNAVATGPSHIGLHAFAPARFLGGVVRDCTIDNNGTIEVLAAGDKALLEHALFEGNTVRHSDLGIRVDTGTQHVTLRGNRFEDVGRETLHMNELQREWAERRAKLLAEPGALARWSFDQPLGPAVDDDTRRGFTAAAAAGATFEPGLVGQAVRPGEAGYLQVGGPTTFEAGVFNLPAGTVMAWVKPDRIEGRYGIVSKRASNTSAPFILSLHDGKVGFEATDRDGGWTYNVQSGKVVEAGAWQHLAAAFVSGEGVTLYRNGVQVARRAATKPIVETFDPLRIGWEAWGGQPANTGQAAFFPGLIDEVQVYGRALSAAAVQAEYERLAPRE